MKRLALALVSLLLLTGACFGASVFSGRSVSASPAVGQEDICPHFYAEPALTRTVSPTTDVTLTRLYSCLMCGHQKTETEFIRHLCQYESETTETVDKYLNKTVTTVFTCCYCGDTYTEEEYIPYPIPAYRPDDWNMILVNRHHRITQNPNVPLTLVQASGEEYMDSRCADALFRMLDDCRAAGLSPFICSSWRSWWLQDYLYTNKVNYYVGKGYSRHYAECKAALETAIPGTSEHQTGLAVDIVASSYRSLNEQQSRTAEQKWLMEHCWEYGFILRYPVGKTDFTGIIYEPWHYRYVGVEMAEYLTKTGLCLEELLDPDYIFTDTDY